MSTTPDDEYHSIRGEEAKWKRVREEFETVMFSLTPTGVCWLMRYLLAHYTRRQLFEMVGVYHSDLHTAPIAFKSNPSNLPYIKACANILTGEFKEGDWHAFTVAIRTPSVTNDEMPQWKLFIKVLTEGYITPSAQQHMTGMIQDIINPPKPRDPAQGFEFSLNGFRQSFPGLPLPPGSVTYT